MCDCEAELSELRDRVTALEQERERHVADPAGSTNAHLELNHPPTGYRYFGFGPQPPEAH